MPRAGADAPLPEPANDEAQRTGHKPATIAFPKRALWPGPLQRKVRRRDHGPQAPHAIDDGAAQWPATTAQRPPRHDGRSPTGHRRRPQHGTDRCGYRRRRMPRAPAHARCRSRLTTKLSGPATSQRQPRSRNAPCGRVRCSARLGGADHGPQAPHALADVRAQRPATAGQRRPRNDKALADWAPAPPAAGDRPIWISAPPDAASRSGRPVARAG